MPHHPGFPSHTLLITGGHFNTGQSTSSLASDWWGSLEWKDSVQPELELWGILDNRGDKYSTGDFLKIHDLERCMYSKETKWDMSGPKWWVSQKSTNTVQDRQEEEKAEETGFSHSGHGDQHLPAQRGEWYSLKPIGSLDCLIPKSHSTTTEAGIQGYP